MPVYEVWCHSCNVTFPPETKHCLHCGARTRPERPGRRLRSGVEEEVPQIYFAEGGVPPASELPMSSAPTEVDEEPVRRSLLRAGMTVLWMVLLAAGYAWRACSQQG